MIKFGTISQIDADKGLVKVDFPDDGIVSKWIPVLMHGTKANKYFHIYDVGEHVACQMDEHCENGVVMGAIYSSAEVPGDAKGADVAGVVFSDGTKITYNRNSRVLTIDGPEQINVVCNEATITADNLIKLEAPTIEIVGDIDLDGGFASNGDITTTTGDIKTTSGEVTAKTIDLTTHIHSGVQPGGGTSALPVP